MLPRTFLVKSCGMSKSLHFKATKDVFLKGHEFIPFHPVRSVLNCCTCCRGNLNKTRVSTFDCILFVTRNVQLGIGLSTVCPSSHFSANSKDRDIPHNTRVIIMQCLCQRDSIPKEDTDINVLRGQLCRVCGW